MAYRGSEDGRGNDARLVTLQLASSGDSLCCWKSPISKRLTQCAGVPSHSPASLCGAAYHVSELQHTLSNLDGKSVATLKEQSEPREVGHIGLDLPGSNISFVVIYQPCGSPLNRGFHRAWKIDDPTGNSFLENPKAPKEDPQLKRTVYKRTKEQNEILGIADEEEEDVEESTEINRTPEGEEEESELSLTEETTSEAKDDPENLKDDPENIKDEVLVFSTLCDRCSRPASTNMKVTKIPHFKVNSGTPYLLLCFHLPTP
ncbi:Zinc finger protein ZPR1 [Portunus trituberculatus]|uniref:Zinc finger protein ZPR1 n=1 Tax=Portunus trituberculatus TaxID=210409 RepID=A0A5B7CLP5_PORTR|nr:Zinc finger protein ZPR1 [Portunus trituberculatus]